MCCEDLCLCAGICFATFYVFALVIMIRSSWFDFESDDAGHL